MQIAAGPRLRGPQALHHIVIPAALAVGELSDIHLADIQSNSQPGEILKVKILAADGTSACGEKI